MSDGGATAGAVSGGGSGAGDAELRAAAGRLRGLFIGAAIFSCFVNILMLTGPLFMLQVYERVLSSRSVPTLVALFALVAVLFLAMGLLDHVRSRVLARAGARFQAVLDPRVFAASIRQSLSPQARSQPLTGVRDLDAIQRALSGPAPLAVFDAPWTPVYIAVIYLFHPWLGHLALVGALVLFTLTLLNERASRRLQRKAAEAQAASESFEQTIWRDSEALTALGMTGAAAKKWSLLRQSGLGATIDASDRTGGYAASSKTLRFFLQSAILALGAWLVIREEVSAGVMIAASIMLGRALAPVEQLIGQWAILQRARQGWSALRRLLDNAPAAAPQLALPRPNGKLSVRGVSAGPPGERLALIRNITFSVEPGEALGIIGPSGSGKTTLARCLTGVWTPLMGEIRLAGATLDQWSPDALGRLVGYVPQDVSLLPGTVAENIARFDPAPDRDAVLTASRLAGAHDTVLALPKGYDTPMGVGGAQLAGGQRQRIALARALYGDPALLILDEPNSNLDATGEQALLDAIAAAKSAGAIVIVIAHRPSAIAVCDHLLMLEQGRQRAFGPRDEVLRQTTRNAATLIRNADDRAPRPGEEDAAATDAPAAQTANG